MAKQASKLFTFAPVLVWFFVSFDLDNLRLALVQMKIVFLENAWDVVNYESLSFFIQAYKIYAVPEPLFPDTAQTPANITTSSSGTEYVVPPCESNESQRRSDGMTNETTVEFSLPASVTNISGEPITSRRAVRLPLRFREYLVGSELIEYPDE